MNYWLLLVSIAPSLLVGGLIVWVWLSIKSQDRYKKELASQVALIATAGHQLRTPLNHLLGLTSSLSARSSNFEPSDRELLNQMLGSGAKLKNTLIDILDIFEMQSDQLEIVEEPHILADTIATIEKLRTRYATEKNLYLNFDVDPSAYNEFIYDEVRLRQCVQNLISQCISQTKTGGVDVTVTVDKERRGPKKSWISITVQDSSPGMSQFSADAYFSPTRYLDNPFLVKEDSSRMALTLSKNLAQLMGGDVTVFSAFSNGVKFTMTLPITFVREVEGKDTDVTAELPKPVQNNSTIENKTSVVEPVIEELSQPETDAEIAALLQPNPTEAQPVQAKPESQETGSSVTPFVPASKEKTANVSIEDATILVVDDNDINLQVMNAFLKRLGTQKVVNATNGQEALDVLAVESCDLILMDLQMPVMGGVTATFEIRASDELWNSIPIIACTAAASSEDKRNCRQAGMNGFLAKPVNIEELTEVLEKALKTEKAQPVLQQKGA